MSRPTYAERAKAKKGQSAPNDLAAGVERIRVAHAYATERADILPDSVRLAAEQVQDVRIEMVERGPQVTALEASVAALVTLCLESSIAGKLITSATRRVLQPVVALHVSRATAPFEALQKQYKGSKLVSQQLLALGTPDVSSIRSRFEDLARTFSKEAGVPTAKATATGVQAMQNPAAGAEMDAGDTAGVSIQEAAINYASEQRLRISSLYAELEGRFLSGHINLEQLLAATTFDPMEDLGAVRRSYRRFFEATIWASLFRFGQEGGATVEKEGPPQREFTAPKPARIFLYAR